MKVVKYAMQSVVALMVFGWLPGCSNPVIIYPERKDIIETVYASGKIIAGNEYKLSSLCQGTIIEKLVKDGDTVSKGQLLYIIGNEAARDKLEAALKNYSIATDNLSGQSPLLNDFKLAMQNAAIRFSQDSVTYFRWKNLWAQHIGTKNNLDNAYSAYQLSLNQKKIAEQKYYAALHELQILHSDAQSRLTAARNDWKEYFIRSDRNGLVFQTFKEEGETVNINEIVALLGEENERIIRLSVDQQDIDKLKTGQQVLLQADVTGNRIYEAIVKHIYPVMNENDQTFRVDARFTQPPAQFFIHSSVEANIIIQKKNNALVLPRNALAGNDSVWVQWEGKEKKLPVKTGITTLDFVEVVSGLKDTSPVLLNPQNKAP